MGEGVILLCWGCGWNLVIMGWQIQSAFHEKSTLPLGHRTQWMHKALNVPTEHFKTGLKHQRLCTAFSWKHIWNLPANLIFASFQTTVSWHKTSKAELLVLKKI